MNSYFNVGDEELLQFYHLKTLSPHTSWKDDSTFVFELQDKQWEVDTLETSYAVLNDLLQQEHEFNLQKGTGKLASEQMMDPLDPSMSATDALRALNLKQTSPDTPKYLINSKSFNPKLYLKHIHADATFEELTQSLDKLDRSLEDQSEELKLLIEANFAKYVRSKSNLDNIYSHFDKLINKNTSGGDETELPIDRLNISLNETMRNTSLKLEPLLNNNDKVQKYQWAIQFVNENRYFFDLPRILKNLFLKKDYTNLMFEYEKATSIHESLSARGANESILRESSIVERIWNEVELVMDRYRKYCWDKLLMPPAIGSNDSQEVFLPLLSKLIDLKATENPVIMWINTRMEYFRKKLEEVNAQMMESILASVSSLLQNGDVDDVELHYYLSMNVYVDEFSTSKSPSSGSAQGHNLMLQGGLTDSPSVIEAWLLIMKFTKDLACICNSFVDFWEHVERFLDNSYQSTLLNERRKKKIIEDNEDALLDKEDLILVISDEEVKILKKQGSSFIVSVASVLSDFFFSTQNTLGKKHSVPPKESDSPASYGFLPPRCNSLSCLRYLPRVVEPIFRFTTELAQLAINSESIDVLKKNNEMIIDRCVSAISSTKLRDLCQMYTLEDWEIYESYDGRYSITKYPEIARSLQQYSIQTVRDILFSYEKLPVINGVSVVSYPNKQLLTGIEIQQIISMEAILESVLKNATKDKENPRNSHTVLTLNNLHHIRKETFPRILQHFDEAFEINLGNKNLEIMNLLDKMESSIFGNYLSDLKFTLRDILEEKFHDINWSLYASNSFRVGDYIIETLMVLVNVHRECFRIGPQLIERILKETQVFISKYLFEAFKPYIGNISSDGLLQVTVDLMFFNKVLKSLLVEDTRTLTMACLQNCFQNDVKRMERIMREVEPIVNSNFERTRVQFASFK